MSVVALVPARGGSKRGPRKHLAPCGGKPLLAWTVEAALGSTTIDRAILSTDDPEIAEAGRRLGLEVPFLRPREIAGDAVPMAPVMQHALTWLQQHGEKIEALVLLQPSSPLRRAAHIDAAVALFRESDVETVVSVVEAPHIFHPMKVLRLRDGRL
ncbi:MAG: acylneuraminate cytidylyltransferase family protein, partial [Kiloniellales bacterium]|nr:acylneuraminate cytidylyltransferase family protein [Kiloniellales bacterium]